MKESATRIMVALLLATTLALMAWPALKVTTAQAALPLTLLLGAATAWYIRRRLPTELTNELTALARKRTWLAMGLSMLITLLIVGVNGWSLARGGRSPTP